MKLEIQKSLLEQELGSICSVLTKGSILDPGRYVILKATKDGLEMFVSRADLLAGVTITCLANVLKVEKEGECALDGNFLLKTLQASALQDMLTLEFAFLGKDEDDALENDDDAVADPDGKDSDKGTDKVKKKSGTITGTYATSEERFTIQTVEWTKKPSLAINGGSTITASGNDYIGLVKRVGVAAGDNKLDSDHTNIFIRGKDAVLDLVTKTTTQLAWAKAPATVQAECEIVAPYHLLKEVAGMLSTEALDLVIVEKTADSPKCVFFRQKAAFGTSPISERTAKICGTGIKFGAFEARLGQLDFSKKCELSKQSLKRVCDGLDLFQYVRTKVSFEPEKKRIVFSKKEANTTTKPLAVEKPVGDAMELDASSKHFKQVVSVCEEDVLRMEFSGKETLLMLGVPEQRGESYSRFRCYFMPF